MVEYLLKQRIRFGKHSARPVDPELVQWADRILVMEAVHGEILQQQYPQSAEKVSLLGGYIPPGDLFTDIADPFGLSSFHYRTAISQITLAVKNLVAMIAAEH
jgi:protein-tyrosine-phosphatase